MARALLKGRMAAIIAAVGAATPVLAQADPLAESFPPVFDWRTLLLAEGGDGSLGYALRDCVFEWRWGTNEPIAAGDVNGDGRADLLHSVDSGFRFSGFGVLVSQPGQPASRYISDPLRNNGSSCGGQLLTSFLARVPRSVTSTEMASMTLPRSFNGVAATEIGIATTPCCSMAATNQPPGHFLGSSMTSKRGSWIAGSPSGSTTRLVISMATVWTIWLF